MYATTIAIADAHQSEYIQKMLIVYKLDFIKSQKIFAFGFKREKMLIAYNHKIIV